MKAIQEQTIRMLPTSCFPVMQRLEMREPLASVIGEDELSPLDKKYLQFGKAFEAEFVGQTDTENRSIIDTLNKGWELLGMLPKEELDRIDTKVLDQYYHETTK